MTITLYRPEEGPITYSDVPEPYGLTDGVLTFVTDHGATQIRTTLPFLIESETKTKRS